MLDYFKSEVTGDFYLSFQPLYGNKFPLTATFTISQPRALVPGIPVEGVSSRFSPIILTSAAAPAGRDGVVEGSGRTAFSPHPHSSGRFGDGGGGAGSRGLPRYSR